MTQVSKSPFSAGALPSITELGGMLGVITRREAAIDLERLGRGKPVNEEQRRDWVQDARRMMTADRLLFYRMDLMRKLISTLPAKSLSDCVVQINVAGHMVMRMNCEDIEKDERDGLTEAVERIAVSVLPVMAAAAGLGMVEFALDEVANLHKERFPAVAL